MIPGEPEPADHNPVNESRCRVVINYKQCAEPAAYGVVLVDCAVCISRNRPACVGHCACVEHAAKLRAGKYHSKTGTLFDGTQEVAEMASLAVLV